MSFGSNAPLHACSPTKTVQNLLGAGQYCRNVHSVPDIGITNRRDVVAPRLYAPSELFRGRPPRPRLGSRGTGLIVFPRASTMAERPLGDFNIPSPEMPSCEGEQARSAQKPPPEKPYDSTGNLPLRDERRAFLRAATKPDVDESEEDGGSSSELEEGSSEEDNGDESDDENDLIKTSARATSSKELVPDSDANSCSSSSDFLEDAPKQKQRLSRITGGSEQIEQSGGKVSMTRARRSWSQLCGDCCAAAKGQ